jgi:hypothetical protein
MTIDIEKVSRAVYGNKQKYALESFVKERVFKNS